MKKRHSLEKIFQSVIGNHDDVDNSESLPNKEDMDRNVEKMLKILRAGENGAISSDNSLDKSELASLVENLHSGYQAVHGRYDHLIGKLKKKIQPKSSDNGGFSIDFISSDSESSESSDSGSEEFEKKQLDEMKIRNNEFETFAAEFAERVKVLQAEIDLLRKELVDSLEREEDTNKKMRCLHEENESLRSENAEAFIRIQEADKSAKELQIEVNRIKDDNSKLQIKIEDLSIDLEAANFQLIDLKKVIVSAEEERTSLTSEIVTMKCQKVELEENCKELMQKLKLGEAEKAYVGRENEKLCKEVQRLELQLCLSNQKLKISKTEHKATQEAYTKMMEERNEERSVIEEQMLKLSRKINFLENNARRLKEVYKVGVSAIANRYHELESVVEASVNTSLKQLSICNSELKVLKKQFTKLNNEKQDLSVRLKYKEGIISTMKEKLGKKDKEISILKAYLIDSEERMKVLEEMLREKKKEVSDKDEAKREAIRQLCLLVEYHRENCSHLYKYLSALRRIRGRSS